MVVRTMKGEIDDAFREKIAVDTAYSDRLSADGIQGEFMMSADFSTCWAVFEAPDEGSLDVILRGFPLYARLNFEVFPLAN
jgi:muconolactone delta-isomerase